MRTPTLVDLSAERDFAQRWLQRSDLTIDELVDSANEILDVLVPTQLRYKVTERLDVRTVRYYASRKLIPRPLGYQGARARYGGRHILRLLFIKHLQSEGQTLKQVTKAIRATSEAEVEQRLFGGPVFAATTAASAEPPEQGNRRFHLGTGGQVEVPRSVLGDADARRALAEDLRALARWLLASERNRLSSVAPTPRSNPSSPARDERHDPDPLDLD